MKLAFCLFKYSPYDGLSRDLRRVLDECVSRGYEPEVFVSTWEGDQPSGAVITHLGAWIVKFLPNHFKDAFYYWRLRLQLKTRSFDAVIGFNRMPRLDVYYGADFCYIERVRKERTPLSRLTWRYLHFRAYEKAVFGTKSQTLILSLSAQGNKAYQEYYHTPDSRFFLLPPTLDVDRKPVHNRTETRENIRQEFGISNGALLLLFIGSGFETKGLDRALRALAALPTSLKENSQLMVIGNDHPGTYQHLATQLGVGNRVHFLGGRLEIPHFLAAGDLLLHPAYQDNTGTVLLEAIAAGVPVLTTDRCGYAPHVQQADAGTVLSSPFDQDQLNQELVNVLESPMRAKWQENGLRYGKDEDLYHMPATTVNVIERYCRKELGRNTAINRPSSGSIRYLDKYLSAGTLRTADFNQIMRCQGQGELIRTSRDGSRKTTRLKFDGKSYYLKTHTGVGWSEIIKNWTYLRLPVLGAKNEWHGVHHLKRHGIDTLTIAGYGTSGGYASRQSFIVTEDIEGAISLEELGYEWEQKPPTTKSELRYKRWLIRRIAEMARTIHQSGANHRDFYLGHFLLQRAYHQNQLSIRKSKLYVIDLHRMQIRRKTPDRWKLKDISGLRYSCLALIKSGLLTKSDLFRFIATYQSASLRDTLSNDRSFWNNVISKSENLLAAEQRKKLSGSPPKTRSLSATHTQH